MYRTLPLAALLLAATQAQAAPTEWTLDLGHAHIGWEIDHMGLSRTVGRFNSGAGIDITGRAEFARDIAQGDILCVQFIALALEWIHY